MWFGAEFRFAVCGSEPISSYCMRFGAEFHFTVYGSEPYFILPHVARATFLFHCLQWFTVNICDMCATLHHVQFIRCEIFLRDCTFMLSGSSPCPVVEQTNNTRSSFTSCAWEVDGTLVIFSELDLTVFTFSGFVSQENQEPFVFCLCRWINNMDHGEIPFLWLDCKSIEEQATSKCTL